MRFPFRKLVEDFPKLGAMIHLPGVGELVQKNIIHQVRWKEHEIAGQVDAPDGRTASLSTLASGYLDLLVFESVVLGQLGE